METSETTQFLEEENRERKKIKKRFLEKCSNTEKKFKRELKTFNHPNSPSQHIINSSLICFEKWKNEKWNLNFRFFPLLKRYLIFIYPYVMDFNSQSTFDILPPFHFFADRSSFRKSIFPCFEFFFTLSQIKVSRSSSKFFRKKQIWREISILRKISPKWKYSSDVTSRYAMQSSFYQVVVAVVVVVVLWHGKEWRNCNNGKFASFKLSFSYTHTHTHTHTHTQKRAQTQTFAAEVVGGDTERKLWLFIFSFFYIYIGKADNKLCHYIVKQIVKCLPDLCMIPSHYSC